MLPTMRRGSAAMMDGGGKVYCPRIVLSIFKVSEHDNQPELEHELLPQYIIDTMNTMEMSVSSETTFFNMKLQPEICPQLMTGSSAEDRGRIDTTPSFYV